MLTLINRDCDGSAKCWLTTTTNTSRVDHQGANSSTIIGWTSLLRPPRWSSYSRNLVKLLSRRDIFSNHFTFGELITIWRSLSVHIRLITMHFRVVHSVSWPRCPKAYHATNCRGWSDYPCAWLHSPRFVNSRY